MYLADIPKFQYMSKCPFFFPPSYNEHGFWAMISIIPSNSIVLGIIFPKGQPPANINGVFLDLKERSLKYELCLIKEHVKGYSLCVCK